MDIQKTIEANPKVIELKKKYQTLINAKNQMIINISHIEADIIKLSGEYESLVKGIIDDSKPQKEPLPIEPQIAEKNIDDGFADAKEPEVMPPSAENNRPLGSEE